jgi:RNA polymerase sigma factor (sigma-70 family)
MKGDIGEMKNIPYDGYEGPHMSRQMQRRRVANVIANELTEHQRRAIVGYYLEQKTITQLALEYGVNKTTVWRTIKRGEMRMRRFLRY